MNYLAHFAFNHDVCRLEPRPYFIMGVALPDLWPRLSRRRRIRWKHVRQATTVEGPARQLRDGLLNHATVDQRFHGLPCFLRWLRELRAGVDGDGVRPALLDFLGHVALELAVDQWLARRNPQLVDRFYGRLEQCDYAAVERHMERVGVTDAHGLEPLLRSFVGRRFLRRYTDPHALRAVLRHVLTLTSVREVPDDKLLHDLLQKASELVHPPTVWDGLTAGPPFHAAARPSP